MELNFYKNFLRLKNFLAPSPIWGAKELLCYVQSRFKNTWIRRKSIVPYPKIIYISINSRCNLRCKMCDVGQNNHEGQFYQMTKRPMREELDLERIKVLFDEIYSFRPLIAITSTEPLLHKDLLPIVQYGKSKGLSLQVTTNGFLLPEFAEEFVSTGLDLLWISLDGPESVHNVIRGNDQSFQKAILGLELINKYKKKYHKNKPLVRINYTINNYNCGVLSKFMASVIPYDIQQVNYSHLNYISNDIATYHNARFGGICAVLPSSISTVLPCEVDCEKLLGEIAYLKKAYYSKTSFSPELNTLEEIKEYYCNPWKFIKGKKDCFIPWKYAQILPNGDCVTMTRCFNLVFGNLYKDDFRSIWNGVEYQQWRKVLRLHRSFPACSRCCGIF